MTANRNLPRAWAALMLIFVLLGGCASMPSGVTSGASLQDLIDILMKEGQQFYSDRKYDDSIARFGEVVAKDANYWLAYVGMARSFIAKGDWTDAINNAKKAYELSPKGQDVVAVFGQALYGGGADALSKGQLADSAARFVEFLKLEPGNTSAWLNVGKAYLGQAQVREAFNAFSQGLAGGGGADRAELLRGLLDGGLQAFSSKDFRTAIDALSEYVKFDATNLSALLNLAKSYWESGQISSALDAFRKVLELNPRQEEALRFLLQGR